MKQALTFPFILATFSPFVWAENSPPENIQQKAVPLLKAQNIHIAENSPAPQLDFTSLANDKTFAENTLNNAIQQQHWGNVEKLLPIYRQFPNHDPILVQYAEAGILANQNQLKSAISLYREIIAKQPDLTPVRFDLARLLMKDFQNEAAKDQFNKIKASNAPTLIKQISDQYLTILQKRNDWQFNFDLSYLRENNINNASKTLNIENTGFVKSKEMLPQSANGIYYGFNLDKDFNLKNNHYLAFRNNFSGKYYWDNKNYNDIYYRTTLGYLNKNSTASFGVLPFFEMRWYGDKKYKNAVGVRGEYARWLSDNWQISTAGEYSQIHSYQTPSLKGSNRFLSSTLVWQRNEKQALFAGVDYNQEKLRDLQASSNSRTFRLGWRQEWGWGVSSRLGLSWSKRNFKDRAIIGGLIPLNKKRQDNEYGINLTLWKRDWHIWGVTPKITYAWKKVDSNIPSLFSTDSQKIYFSFEKVF